MSIKLIIILGYTLNNDCSMQSILQSRLDSAISLYQPEDEFIVCGKRPPKVLVQSRCEKKTEAEVMKEYLIKKGVPAGKIFKEDQSTTTFGNAYYTYWNFLKDLSTDKTIYIVSNQFHYPLVKYSFDKVLGNKYSYIFHAVPDPSLKFGSEEIKQWENIIQEMVKVCYPELFANVNNGDIKAIKSILEGPKNIRFESCVKNLLNLNTPIDMNDFI